jgi:hypothetical protein
MVFGRYWDFFAASRAASRKFTSSFRDEPRTLSKFNCSWDPYPWTGAFCGTLFAFLASMVFSYAVWADNGDAAGASREA